MRLGFAMTINKSQGQTLQNVGVWLSDPCFSHGQLYVAVSRVVSPKTIKFAIRKIDNLRFNFTRNVVYKEVLNNKKEYGEEESAIKTSLSGVNRGEKAKMPRRARNSKRA